MGMGAGDFSRRSAMARAMVLEKMPAKSLRLYDPIATLAMQASSWLLNLKGEINVAKKKKTKKKAKKKTKTKTRTKAKKKRGAR